MRIDGEHCAIGIPTFNPLVFIGGQKDRRSVTSEVNCELSFLIVCIIPKLVDVVTDKVWSCKNTYMLCLRS